MPTRSANRKRSEHLFLQEKMALGLHWHAQALLLARRIRGELDGYPPYIRK